MAKKLLTGDKLRKRANELGVSMDRTVDSDAGTNDAIVQERVIAAEKHIREGRIWIFALISAIASAISALTALIAVLSTKTP